MQPKPTSKKPIIIAIVILLILGGYYFFSTGNPTDDATFVEGTTAGVDSEASGRGAKILSLLNQISSLEIDSTFFSSPVYSSLVDHTVPIYEQNVGKDNPFYSQPASAAAAGSAR